jgi:transcriptional regulator with XRE-family HTH domain
MASKFGNLLKRLRAVRGLTLRDFCQQNRLDPGNYSRLERGLYPPPQNHEILERYARCFGLVPGSDDWLEFFDAAAAENGRIPDDLMSDRELVEKLPVLFRTLRGQPVPLEKLDELVDKIKRS